MATKTADIHYSLPDIFGKDKTTEDIYITSHAIERWIKYRHAKTEQGAINAIRYELQGCRVFKMNRVSKLLKEISHGNKAKYYQCKGVVFVFDGTRLVTLYPKT